MTRSVAVLLVLFALGCCVQAQGLGLALQHLSNALHLSNLNTEQRETRSSFKQQDSIQQLLDQINTLVPAGADEEEELQEVRRDDDEEIGFPMNLLHAWTDGASAVSRHARDAQLTQDKVAQLAEKIQSAATRLEEKKREAAKRSNPFNFWN